MACCTTSYNEEMCRRCCPVFTVCFSINPSSSATVGQGGLLINEPGTARSLKNLPGSWSDQALACLIHVGMKWLMPDEDSGLGIEAKYQEAMLLHGSGGKTPWTNV